MSLSLQSLHLHHLDSVLVCLVTVLLLILNLDRAELRAASPLGCYPDDDIRKISCPRLVTTWECNIGGNWETDRPSTQGTIALFMTNVHLPNGAQVTAATF